MKFRFKTVRKENEVNAYIESVRDMETLTTEEKENFIKDLMNDYRKNGFIKIIR